MLLKYTKQGNFHGLKEKSGLSLIITRYSENFLKTKEKAKQVSRKIEDEHVKYISIEVDKNGSLSASLNVN